MEEDRKRLLGELYRELHARAERLMRDQPRDTSLQATALVHEACLKIFGAESLASSDRPHLLALASTAMRQVLVDHARARGRVKRTAPGARCALDDISIAYEGRAIDLVLLDEALVRLAEFDETMSRAVELHFFGGLSMAETAEAIDMPLRTLERRWAVVRRWMRAELG